MRESDNDFVRSPWLAVRDQVSDGSVLDARWVSDAVAPSKDRDLDRVLDLMGTSVKDNGLDTDTCVRVLDGVRREKDSERLFTSETVPNESVSVVELASVWVVDLVSVTLAVADSIGVSIDRDSDTVGVPTVAESDVVNDRDGIGPVTDPESVLETDKLMNVVPVGVP